MPQQGIFLYLGLARWLFCLLNSQRTEWFTRQVAFGILVEFSLISCITVMFCLSFSIRNFNLLFTFVFNLYEYFRQFSSSVSGQVAVAVGFLTQDPSLIWNTAEYWEKCVAIVPLSAETFNKEVSNGFAWKTYHSCGIIASVENCCQDSEDGKRTVCKICARKIVNCYRMFAEYTGGIGRWQGTQQGERLIASSAPGHKHLQQTGLIHSSISVRG